MGFARLSPVLLGFVIDFAPGADVDLYQVLIVASCEYWWYRLDYLRERYP